MSSQDEAESPIDGRDGDNGSAPTAAGEIEQVSLPGDAFQALGNDVRTGILETLYERTSGNGTASASFSELFEASDVDTTAGFAYHLRQLDGSYVRKVDAGEGDEASESETEGDGYELTYAGRRIAREIAAGTYTRRVDHPSVALEDPCPFCDRETLEARSRDNVVTVSCAGCDRTVLDLGFPPSGLESHGDEFPDALDRYHRHRLGRMRDGICPDCGGSVVGRLVEPSPDVADELPSEHADHVQAELECESCGTTTRCPVSLTLLDHSAVVSFYRDRGREVDDRPIWNVGSEWAEAVLSEDPFAVRVVVELEGDVLALYVDETLSVVDVQRSTNDPTEDADAASDTVSETESDARADTSAEAASPQPEPDVAAGQPADSTASSGS
ncbi:DUF7351 domain-containing protein [Halopiger xanaduensis]|uniref:Putative transcriptional regulator, ArsR family n=1 Tax=Halopiger xanaduensis (strain DSM 18323 / JCM 14033 / SH-6) TaxID=797210 RepID=F8D3K7_HALXS|nr:hypothetical protein [Halopiger xanaduensis]AEH37372.1 putative transcriptional regulator, ArsR family [Halopiger xanaduensis SH-6]